MPSKNDTSLIFLSTNVYQKGDFKTLQNSRASCAEDRHSSWLMKGLYLPAKCPYWWIKTTDSLSSLMSFDCTTQLNEFLQDFLGYIPKEWVVRVCN